MMLEWLKRQIRRNLSWRALSWRWTALRTGRSFAEIVLRKTSLFRVEHVSLIHRETGLLLQHVAADVEDGRDADLVGANLTAIVDFVRDSFGVEAGDTLDALRVGELMVIVEAGPHAALAGVVRGSAPASLRTTFQDALEQIHHQLGPELQGFQGDSTPFERARHTLEACLVSRDWSW